jgi:hypothetical protein
MFLVANIDILLILTTVKIANTTTITSYEPVLHLYNIFIYILQTFCRQILMYWIILSYLCT